jgi:hypothetical protein
VGVLGLAKRIKLLSHHQVHRQARQQAVGALEPPLFHPAPRLEHPEEDRHHPTWAGSPVGVLQPLQLRPVFPFEWDFSDDWLWSL